MSGIDATQVYMTINIITHLEKGGAVK